MRANLDPKNPFAIAKTIILTPKIQVLIYLYDLGSKYDT